MHCTRPFLVRKFLRSPARESDSAPGRSAKSNYHFLSLARSEILKKTFRCACGIIVRMALVIVGLGNTGKEYEKTRHNAGRSVVEFFAKQEGFDEFVLNKIAKALVSKGAVGAENVTLVLPETMMNLSGKAVAPFVKSVKAAKTLLVVHDDLDLPLGTIKMVFGRGSGGHKGVESVMRAIKTKEFARIRIGISGVGKKNQAKKVLGEEKVIKLVIGKWKPTEEAVVKKVLKKSTEAARLFATEGIEAATMFANTR
ncbi:aminoacyl-tRNA hydrolase [Candidatus Kaiserbacteria bacterium]|nr:aminoacyl-tRNA hydrolase [Candidatus Kaiserbacteria bacterium]